MLTHTLSNPVMKVAAWAIEEDAAIRRDAARRDELGYVGATKRRAANRWRLALLLLRNPSLSHYRVPTRPEVSEGTAGTAGCCGRLLNLSHAKNEEVDLGGVTVGVEEV